MLIFLSSVVKTPALFQLRPSSDLSTLVLKSVLYLPYQFFIVSMQTSAVHQSTQLANDATSLILVSSSFTVTSDERPVVCETNKAHGIIRWWLVWIRTLQYGMVRLLLFSEKSGSILPSGRRYLQYSAHTTCLECC